MWDWVEQPGLEAVDDDRVLEEERWKTVQLLGMVDKLYCKRLVLIRHIGHHEAAWAAQTGRVVVLARERARANEVDLQISEAQLIIKQRQEEVHPIHPGWRHQYQEAWCEPSPPVPSPTSGLSPVPSGPSTAPLLMPQPSAVPSQALLVSPLPSQQSQQVRGEEEASRKVDDEQVVWDESEKRESEKRESEKRGDARKEEPPQQQEHDPSKAKCGSELMDLFGAGDEGAGQQQLLRRQQRQQQQSQAKESRAADLSARSREEVQRDDEIVEDTEKVEDRRDGKVVGGNVGEDEKVEDRVDGKVVGGNVGGDGRVIGEVEQPRHGLQLQQLLELALPPHPAREVGGSRPDTKDGDVLRGRLGERVMRIDNFRLMRIDNFRLMRMDDSD